MLLLNISILASLLGSIHGSCMPPVIRCPRIRTLYTAERGSTTATVSWPPPTVTSYRYRTKISLKTDRRPGSRFGPGKHTVVYEANARGLKDFCLFTFTVREAKECPLLVKPANSKGYACTNGRKVGSICFIVCDEAKGYQQERGQFTRCSADHTWTNLKMECKDIEAPQIQNCPTHTVVKWKDPTSEQTYVRWEEPLTVTDNSGERIEVRELRGKASATGGLFPEGVTLVRFTAQDGAKNTALICSFIVRIKALICDPPKMDDQYLETPGCVDYREGQSCRLQCYLALKLVGPRFIKCMRDGSSTKGYWSYGQHDSPPAEKPYCKVHNCTELRAPNNGAISCDNWELGRTCSISCNQDYDIPESVSFVSSVYYCDRRTGRWNNDHVPDCVYRVYGRKFIMRGYNYFHGSCWASTPEIKSNFLKVINEASACPREKFCTVENVRVRCGDETEDYFDDW